MKMSYAPLFYIYAPIYRENAAGIRVLYYLCEELNKRKCDAFIVLSDQRSTHKEQDSEQPVLTITDLESHTQDGRIPIVIYSETIPGNPMNAQKVVRYFLNFPGALGTGNNRVQADEMKIAYSKNIFKQVSNCDGVLYIPAVKMSELPGPITKNPNLNLMYAGKYRAYVGQPGLPAGVQATEIYRRGPKAQSHDEVLQLLAQASRIYLWENSTIGTEAVLLGTVCVFVPNSFLNQIILGEELGPEGYAENTTDIEIERAIKTLPLAKAKYESAMELSSKQIDDFIEKSQHFFNQQTIKDAPRIKMPKAGRFLPKYRLAMFLCLISNFGLLRALRVTYHFGYFSIGKKAKKN
jgi:hypothetical protein